MKQPWHHALPHPVWSYGLVALQFGSIGAILMTGAWLSDHWLVWAAQAVGVLLGLWAVHTMHLGHFNIIPTPSVSISQFLADLFCRVREQGAFALIVCARQPVPDDGHGYRYLLDKAFER